MNAYQELTREAFVEGVALASRNGMGGTLDPATIGENPHLVEALAALEGCVTPEDAARAVGTIADRLHAEAQALFRPDASRSPESLAWIDLSLAMGWLRTAAPRMWEVPSPHAGGAAPCR